MFIEIKFKQNKNTLDLPNLGQLMKKKNKVVVVVGRSWGLLIHTGWPNLPRIKVNSRWLTQLS